MADAPLVTFNNGQQYPILGLGTWKSEPGKVAQAVKDAIDAGYRHIDCAYVYGNEKEVGEGIRSKIEQNVVKRSDLYITSKLWNSFHRPDWVEKGARNSLDNLGIERFDLYLIHWPTAYKEGFEEEPKDANGKVIYSDVTITDTWKAMEKLVEKGWAKSIGVSNFNSEQITIILSIAKIKPVVNQVECHPWLNQDKLKAFCESRGILITAYSVLGSADRPWAEKDDPKLVDDPKVKEIAAKHDKDPGQILIKFQVQKNNLALAKSVRKERIISNAQIFDFCLDDQDIADLEGMDCHRRLCPLEWISDHKDYPFNIEF